MKISSILLLSMVLLAPADDRSSGVALRLALSPVKDLSMPGHLYGLQLIFLNLVVVTRESIQLAYETLQVVERN
jgi:hypothetical protein